MMFDEPAAECRGNSPAEAGLVCVHLFDDAHRVLLSRTALHTTCPGRWTCSAWGAVLPGEDAMAAAIRHSTRQLGLVPTALVRPAPEDSQLACVVFGRITGEPHPHPDDIAETTWVEWADLHRTARTIPALLSPWCARQVRALGPTPPKP